MELARRQRVFIAGDDFKSGQTKFKSAMVDFLVSSGIKPESIVSYNHLGNNDGKNLSSEAQFKSKERSKANVVDDVVHSNSIMYAENEKPDHCVVIKYVPYVADSKRAMDEYISRIFMGGKSQYVIHNTCEDSLLAAPLILDLIILTEFFSRIRYSLNNGESFQDMDSVLTVLSFFLKAPKVPQGAPLVNAFFPQKGCLENIFRALMGLPPNTNMGLEFKMRSAK